MPRPRSQTPPLRWFEAKQQYCIYLNRKRRLLGTDKKAAEAERLRLIGQQLARPKSSTVPSFSGELSVIEAFERYRAYAEKRYADSRARHRIRQAIGAAIADDKRAAMPISQFDRAVLLEIRDELTARQPALSRRYINNLATAVKTAISWMVDRRIAPPAVLYEVRALKQLIYLECGADAERPKVQSVDPAIVARTLPFCPPTVQAMVRLQQLTGMRPGELVIMRRCDVSTSPTQRVDVPCLDATVAAEEIDGVLIWRYAPSQHKGIWRGKYRVIPIGPEAQAVLAPFLLRREPDEYVFQPMESMKGERGKNMIRVGQRYKVRSYYEAIDRAVARHNRKLRDSGRLLFFAEILPNWFPYRLRHSLGTAAAGKIDSDAAGLLLGHSPGSRALNIYVEDSLRKAAEAARKIG